VKNLKIGTLLIIGFTTMLLFVIVLGVVSYRQSGLIQLQTEIMFSHPVKVRKAIGSLEADILSMRLGLRDLMLSENNREKQDAMLLMELSAADAQKQFNVLNDQYLGPGKDVDEAYKAFINWKIARGENIRLALSGDFEKVKASLLPTGTIGVSRGQMMGRIRKIDEFAQNKSEALYASSVELKEALNRQLFMLVVAILLLSLLINNFLLRNIRKPIAELTNAAKRFHNGDMNSRSTYSSQNEFGLLSDSFNTMVEDIQVNKVLDEKIVDLAGLMLSEYDIRRFFQATLNSLATHTGSQMAAIYLLSDDKRNFEHFESIGLDDNARISFDAGRLEGEFGTVLSSHKVHHIQDIPGNTRFMFQTVSGKFIPREIITIPILAGHDIIAIISLVSIGSFSKQSIQLIDRILVTLCARVEGILAYHKIKIFSEQLEYQNRELEAQKTALASQSAELTEQNRELEMQKKQLFEASRLKTSFLSNMSHELRTPLNSVIALSGVLNRRLINKISQEEYGYLEVIERNGKRLLSLINDILDISRIEAGREEIEIAKFDVGNLITEVLSMINPQAQQNKIELVYIEGDKKLDLASDIDKCRHVLQNLIGNAVKFTENGSVKISALKSDHHIAITVTDTGIGISENHLPYIFDEFRQADGSTSRKFGGTGLGLAIAKKYANLLGGTISVKSDPGKGSAFTLTLPVSYTAEINSSKTEAATWINNSLTQIAGNPGSSLSGKTILLVEDSEPAIIQIKDILEESGYLVLVAQGGGEGLEFIAQTIPDAMILDLMMPGIDGFEVLKTLREAEPTAHIPVLILTAKHITKEELRFLKRNNVHQLIQKGDVNRYELLNAVATMVLPEKLETVISQRKQRAIEGKPVVLVVEDNPDNMITVKALLGDNYSVIEATNGNEGIEMARQHHPNLILLDIALPGIDGIKVFKALRHDPRLKHIPVIALTASAMISDREAILACGLDAYIAKPIDDKLFFKTINAVLYGN
jgi:signal transduction histidine kinase/CheY-like chemotaxis protein/HAMP domain-containing protein